MNFTKSIVCACVSFLQMPNDVVSNDSAYNDAEMTKLNGFELNSNKSSNGTDDVACQNDAITKAIEVKYNDIRLE